MASASFRKYPFLAFFLFCIWGVTLVQAASFNKRLILPLNPPELDIEVPADLLRRSAYIITINANTMENAIAQMVRFYERKGWEVAKPILYSGQALIYEEAPLSKKEDVFPAEIRTRHIRITSEFLCTRTEGAFRSTYLDERVLVFQKREGSLLQEIKMPKVDEHKVSIADALAGLATLAGRGRPDINIRFERPKFIHLRAGEDPTILPLLEKHLYMYRKLPGELLDTKITYELRSNQRFMDALANLIKAQSLPLYLTLRPDTKNREYSHVLTIDTLPAIDIPRYRLTDYYPKKYHRQNWWYFNQY